MRSNLYAPVTAASMTKAYRIWGTSASESAVKQATEHRIADALRALARALLNQGNQERGSETVEESIACSDDALGTESGLVDSLSILVATRQMIDDYEGSVPILEENLMLARKLENHDGIYLAVGNVGAGAPGTGDYAQAAFLITSNSLNNWKTG